jgi:hypothetical protein
MKAGWGSVRVTAKIGSTKWTTSIFPDKALGTFLLPLKAQVRKAEDLFDGSEVNVELII